MTIDQKIQIWNVIGTWIAGAATFSAVLVSLHLARRTEKIRLNAFVGLRLLFLGDGSPSEEHLNFGVTNLGDRPVTVTGVGWKVGKRKNTRYAMQTLSGHWTSQYPIELTHGKHADFLVSFTATPNWITDFVHGFLKDDLKTLVALIHTSVGQTIEVKPEDELLKQLEKAMEIAPAK